MKRRIRSWAKTIAERLAISPFAVAIAVLGINAGINLFTKPGSLPQHHLLSPFDTLSVAMYGGGGVLMIVGIVMSWANVDAAGCIAFAGGALIACLSYTALLGFRASWNLCLLLTVIAVSALVRAAHLARGKILVLVNVPREDGTGLKLSSHGD